MSVMIVGLYKRACDFVVHLWCIFFLIILLDSYDRNMKYVGSECHAHSKSYRNLYGTNLIFDSTTGKAKDSVKR